MNVFVYLIPVVFSAVMLINGAIRYWGHFDRASMEVMFDRYFETKREVRNWKQSQKIYDVRCMGSDAVEIETVRG